MIDTQAIRSKILDLAIRGQLTEQLPEDGSAEKLYQQIQAEKLLLIKAGKIKKEKDLPAITKEVIPFEIPDNWKWVRLNNISYNVSAGGDKPEDFVKEKDELHAVPVVANGVMNGGIMGYTATATAPSNTITVAGRGTIGFPCFRDYAYCPVVRLIVIEQSKYIDPQYLYYTFCGLPVDSVGSSIPQLTVPMIITKPIPLPPLAEQKRIVEKIEQAFSVLDTIDELQKKYADNMAVLKSKLVDLAIQGKLTEQLPEDGTAEELYQQIQAEREKQEKVGIIKAVELLPQINKEDVLLEIPSNWKWTTLGNVSYIVRGGSPRPIKEYITTRDDGINWIKIGDVEKGGKYIYSTHEKIIPEGESKSRRVYPGDFLLTNSMSFGRPYISQIEGCIHDGWLLIHNLSGFDSNYLYYLLSSEYMYAQFKDKASGSTVDNLNIDKVKAAIVPLPPLAEQKRIVERLEKLLAVCDGLN